MTGAVSIPRVVVSQKQLTLGCHSSSEETDKGGPEKLNLAS